MHPYLKNLNLLSLAKVLEEHKCIKIFQDYGLLPTCDTLVRCDCGADMKTEFDINRKLGFYWKCLSKNGCGKGRNPLKGTFFSGMHISFTDIFCLIVLFIKKEGTNNCYEMLRD